MMGTLTVMAEKCSGYIKEMLKNALFHTKNEWSSWVVHNVQVISFQVITRLILEFSTPDFLLGI